MNAKLETIAAFLAGHQGPATESLRAELADPSSEASRLLEAVRSASKRAAPAPRLATLAAPRQAVPAEAAPVPVALPPPPAAKPGSFPLRAAAAVAAALLLAALGAAGWQLSRRVGDLGETLARREATWGDRFARLERSLARDEAARTAKAAPRPEASPAKAANQAPVAPAAGPSGVDLKLALNRVESKLDALEARLGTPSAPASATPAVDPASIAAIRRDLEELRQGLEASDRAGREEGQALREGLENVLYMIRQFAGMRGNHGPPIQVPVPYPLPVPPGNGPSRGSVNPNGTPK